MPKREGEKVAGLEQKLVVNKAPSRIRTARKFWYSSRAGQGKGQINTRCLSFSLTAARGVT